MGVRLTAGAAPSTPSASSASPARWRVVGASAEGASHHATGAGCQDAHRAGVVGAWLVIVAADGAGSAPRAREGAHHAVDAAFAFVRHAARRTGRTGREIPPDAAGSRGQFVEEVAVDAIEAARERLAALAAGMGTCTGEPVPLADLATTLTVVVVDDAGVGVAQIGDGAVVVRDAAGLALALAPERSEYLNETRFVTSPSWAGDRRSAAIATAGPDAIDGVAVLTDGLQLLAFDMATDTPHRPFFEPLFAFAGSPEATTDELARFLASPRVHERTDDDTTLVVAVRA